MRSFEFFAIDSDFQLALTVAQSFDKKLHLVKVEQFADSELTMIMPESLTLSGITVFIIHSTSRPVHDNIMRLALLVEHLKTRGAQKVIAIVPYFGYARQCVAPDGKPGAAGLVARLLQSAGIDELVVVEPHDACLKNLFSLPFYSVDLHATIARHIESHILNTATYCLVAPDGGARERVQKIAAILGAPVVVFDKQRHGINKVKVIGRHGDCLGDSAIIIDDIIDTGSTAINVIQSLRSSSVKNIYAYFVHPVFSGNALQKLRAQRLVDIFVAGTIVHPDGVLEGVKTFTIAPQVSWVIKKVMEKNGN